MKNILIIEDANNNMSYLIPELTNEGFSADHATDAKTAFKLLEDKEYDLILFDLVDYDTCKLIKENYDIPIIVFKKQEKQENRFQADEYITKPFENSKLFAVIQKLLSKEQEELSFKELKIDYDSLEVLLCNVPIELSKKEFDLIHYLVKNKNKVLSRDQLLNHVWGVDYLGETNVVDVNIKHLRDKFGKITKEEYIKTIRGVGYCCKE